MPCSFFATCSLVAIGRFQTEISKRLNAIIVQIVPFLQGEHQQQVLTAVDRAKQITMTELNAVIGVSVNCFFVWQKKNGSEIHICGFPPCRVVNIFIFTVLLLIASTDARLMYTIILFLFTSQLCSQYSNDRICHVFYSICKRSKCPSDTHHRFHWICHIPAFLPAL